LNPIGYGAGSGTAAAQIISKQQGVTVNGTAGQITLNSFSLSSNTTVSFTMTNSAIASTDVILWSVAADATLGAYQVQTSLVGTGSASVTVLNRNAATLSESAVLNFVVLKGSAN
jgi:filamentous hemagglutinin family protein